MQKLLIPVVPLKSRKTKQNSRTQARGRGTWLCTTGIHVHYNQRMGYITQSKNNSNDIDQKHSNCKNSSDKHCVLLVYVSLCKLQSLPIVYFDFSWSSDCLISHLSSFAVPQDSPSVTAKVKECRNARRIIKKIEKFIFFLSQTGFRSISGSSMTTFTF